MRRMERLLDIRSKRASWIILCTILALGAALRIYGLTRQSLWLDEVNGVRIAEKSFRGIISELKDDVSPPLHYFIMHAWMEIFGAGELSTRVFVCIFGVLLIPAIYYIGSSLFDHRMGIISAFIAAIGRFHVRYSQEVRMYSMLALLGLLSIYLLYKAITTNSKISWIGYTIFTTLTIYTHNYGIFIAVSGVVFFAIYAMTQSARLRYFLIAQAVIIALYLPWLRVLLIKHYGSGNVVGWIPHMRPYHLYKTFKVYSGLSFEVFGPVTNSLITWLGFALFMCCFLAGIFSIKRYKKIIVPYIERNKKLLLLLCYLFVTLGIPILISIRKPIYLPSRYSIAAWPAFPLILGIGVSKIRNLHTSLTVLVIILFISSASLYWHHFVWIKAHDRSIASFIDSEATENDLIVLAPNWWYDMSMNYYLRTPLKYLGYPHRCMKEIPGNTKEKFPRKPDDMVDLARSKLDSSVGRAFFVYPVYRIDLAIVKRLFDENFTKLKSRNYGAIEITIYSNIKSATDH